MGFASSLPNKATPSGDVCVHTSVGAWYATWGRLYKVNGNTPVQQFNWLPVGQTYKFTNVTNDETIQWGADIGVAGVPQVVGQNVQLGDTINVVGSIGDPHVVSYTPDTCK